MSHTIVWRGDEEWRAEHVELELRADGLRATGVQLGVDPEPYRADYELEAGPDWITQRLSVRVGARRLDLTHDGAGGWAGEGIDAGALSGALDCDLAYSPLTNLMPVRRHRLHERPGTHDFTMAWVSLPDLGVHADPQRYEHLAPGRVRFTSLDPDADFTAELELDADGLVLRYPEIAERA